MKFKWLALLLLFIVPLSFVTLVGGLVAFGTYDVPPPPKELLEHSSLSQIDYIDLPRHDFFTVRPGEKVAYREYPSEANKVAFLIHGSSSQSKSMHGLARFLSKEKAAYVYAVDVRGHGYSGTRGHIDYIGQLEDDLADTIKIISAKHPNMPLVVVGFSMGGGFAIRFASSPYGDLADCYIFLAPFIHQNSPTNQENYGGWALVHLPRIVGLVISNKLGITRFNHLPVIDFSLPEKDKYDFTASYSYNLAFNFRPREDYQNDVRNLRLPAVLLVGRNDEYFRPEMYEADIGSLTSSLMIEIIDGVNHTGLIVEDQALESIKSWMDYLVKKADG